MVKKIIDFVFPMVTLPEDEEKRSLVIKNYEKFSKKTLPIWPISLFLVFSAASITQVFSVYNEGILICILIPTSFFVISAGLLLKYKLDHQSTHKNLLGILFYSYGFISCIAIMIYGMFIDNSIQINVFLSILILSFFVHYIGYWYMIKSFNKRMAAAKVSKGAAGLGAIGGCIGYFIAKEITNSMEMLIFIFLMIFFTFISSAALVNYRQYDNIQRAKNGQPFK